MNDILSSPILLLVSAFAMFVLSLPPLRSHRLARLARVTVAAIALVNAYHLVGMQQDKKCDSQQHINAEAMTEFTTTIEALVQAGRHDEAIALLKEFNKRDIFMYRDERAFRDYIQGLIRKGSANQAL